MREDSEIKHVDRYAELSPALRTFLESMDEEDVQTAKDLMKAYRNAGVISRFAKWILIVMFTTFMGIAGIFEKLVKLFGFDKAG